MPTEKILRRYQSCCLNITLTAYTSIYVRAGSFHYILDGNNVNKRRISTRIYRKFAFFWRNIWYNIPASKDLRYTAMGAMSTKILLVLRDTMLLDAKASQNRVWRKGAVLISGKYSLDCYYWKIRRQQLISWTDFARRRWIEKLFT